ncbi:MAG: ROK family protein [Clostridia bacterium]|nr:ROK family protein [Clostridia bacterium]
MKIGVDLGGSHVAVGIVSDEGKILSKQEKDLVFSNEDKEQLIRDTIVSLINNALRRINIPIFLIEKIGIGVPGEVQDNKVKKCTKFEIFDWDLAGELEDFYKVKVELSNDGYLAALAERKFGSLMEEERAVFLCIGTGIGSAILNRGVIIPSEIGHTIIKEDGNICNCGRQGCFETYASMKVFKENIIRVLGLKESTTSEEIANYIRVNENDNEELKNYINEYIEYLEVGISNIINTIHPDTICIGGGFVYFEDILMHRLQERINTQIYKFQKPKIVLAKLGNDAGIIGATCF